MKEVTWGIRKARVWLDELPEWRCEVIETAERHVREREMLSHHSRGVAVELFVPVGGRAHYGALGATFVPQATGQLVIRVQIAANQGQLFQGALASRSELPLLGFPAEYVEGVFDDIIQFDGIQALGAGTLSFTHAVHGAVGSSIWFFQVLSHIVVRLLTMDMLSLSNEVLVELLQQELRKHAPPTRTS